MLLYVQHVCTYFCGVDLQLMALPASDIARSDVDSLAMQDGNHHWQKGSHCRQDGTHCRQDGTFATPQDSSS